MRGACSLTTILLLIQLMTSSNGHIVQFYRIFFTFDFSENGERTKTKISEGRWPLLGRNSGQILVISVEGFWREGYFRFPPVRLTLLGSLRLGPTTNVLHNSTTVSIFYVRKQNASRVFAVVWASVCPSIRPSVCRTRDLYQNVAS